MSVESAKRRRCSPMMAPLEQLPAAVLGYCLSFLDPRETAALSPTSSTFATIIHSSAVTYSSLDLECCRSTPEAKYYLSKVSGADSCVILAEHDHGDCLGWATQALKRATKLQNLSLIMADQAVTAEAIMGALTVFGTRLAGGLQELALYDVNPALLAVLFGVPVAPELRQLSIHQAQITIMPLTRFPQLRELSIGSFHCEHAQGLVTMLRTLPLLEELSLDVELATMELAPLLAACPNTLRELALVVVCPSDTVYELPGNELLALLKRFRLQSLLLSVRGTTAETLLHPDQVARLYRQHPGLAYCRLQPRPPLTPLLLRGTQACAPELTNLEDWRGGPVLSSSELVEWVLVHPYLTELHIWSQRLLVADLTHLSTITRATSLRHLKLSLDVGTRCPPGALTAMLTHACATLEELHLVFERQQSMRLVEMLEGDHTDSLYFPQLKSFSFHIESPHRWSEADLAVMLRRMPVVTSLECEYWGRAERKDWKAPTLATMLRVIQRCHHYYAESSYTICRDEADVQTLMAAVQNSRLRSGCLAFRYDGPGELAPTNRLSKIKGRLYRYRCGPPLPD